MSINKLTK